MVAYFHESQEMVLDAFNKAFSFYDGVPNRVIIDNPKTMVLTVGKGKERVFHPRFLALMSHYSFYEAFSRGACSLNSAALHLLNLSRAHLPRVGSEAVKSAIGSRPR